MKSEKTKKSKHKIIVISTLILIVIIVMFLELEGSQTNKIIKDFTTRGIYQTTENYTAYYKVIMEKDYEDASLRVVDEYDDIYVGTVGDVYISSKDPLSFFVTQYISNNIRIGHSAIVNSEDAKTTVEVTGNDSKENNVVKEYENDWFQEECKEVIVMRSKNLDCNKRIKIKEWLIKHYGMRYNYFFLLHMENRFYCLDLCSQAYESIEEDIDGKSIFTFGSSIVQDEDMYIIYYKKKVNKENIKYEVYYLSEE